MAIIMRDGSSRIDNAKLRELVHQAPVGVRLTDERGIELLINDRWCALAGLSRENARDMGWLHTVHPEDRDRVQRELRRSQEDGTGYSLEYRIQRPDGSLTWVISKSAPLSDAPGRSEGHIHVMTDIASHREVEHHLIRTTQKIWESLRSKFNELTPLTDELRAPLKSMPGLSALLQNELEQAKQEMNIRMIYESARRLTRTIDRILQISRAESTNSRPPFKKTDLAPVIRTAASRFTEIARSKGVDLKVILPEDSLAAFVDGAMLQESLNHVLDNAFKFTHKGSVNVELRQLESGRSPYAEIAVHDTGIGIPEEYQSSVFEPFFQVSNGPGRAYEGTGLGLTAAKSNIEEMNGKIALQSAPDKGTRVLICFPLVQIP
jgi:PAS domain S-box-containing protein